METTAPVQKRLKKPGLDYFVYFFSKFCFASIACIDLYYFAAFLTDTALFSIAIVGVIQITTTVIEMIFSFFYGAIMERVGRHLPWGQTRSWLVLAPPISSILFIFTFVRVSSSEVVSAVVIIIAFIASHVIWSVGECSMNAQMVNMTDDVNERTQMSINIGRGAMGSSLAFGFIAGFFLNTLFAGSPFAYVYLIIIFAIVYYISYLLLFWRSKGCEPTRAEYEAIREREKKVAEISSRSATLGEAYKAVFTSKNGLLMLLTNLLMYLYCFLAPALMFYYYAYTLNNLAIMGTMLSVKGLTALIGGLFIVPLQLKLCKGSKKNLFIMSSVLMIISLILPWLPPVRTSALFYNVVTLIFSLLCGGTTATQVGLMADVGVEISYKNKKNLSAFTVSFITFPLKVALMIRSVLVTAALAMTGYSAGMEITSKQVDGFATAYLIWPAVICLLSIITIALYKNPEAKVQEMIDANAKAEAEDMARVNAILAERGEL